MKPGSTEMKTADAKEALEQLDALATLVHETSAVLVSVIDGPTETVYRSGDHALALYFDLYEYGKYLGSARSEVGTWIKRTEFKSRMPQPVRDGRPLFDGDNSQIPEPIRIKETPQPVFSPEERKAMVQRGAELVKVQAQYSAEARKLATALRIAASELDQAMQNRESSTEKAMQNLATAVRMLDDAGDQRSKLLGDAMEYSKELFREFARDDEKVLDGQSKENRVQDRTSEMADKLKSGEPEPLDDYVDKEFGDKSSDKLHQSIDEERKKNPDSTVPRTEKSPEGNQPTKPIDPDLAGSEPSAGSETVDNPFGPLDL